MTALLPPPPTLPPLLPSVPSPTPREKDEPPKKESDSKSKKREQSLVGSSDGGDRGLPPYHDAGSFYGGMFSIGHRDTNSVLLVDLQPGATIKSKRRTMVSDFRQPRHLHAEHDADGLFF